MTPQQLITLAHRLAKRHAQDVIESDGKHLGDDWYDVAQAERDYGEVRLSVAYLDARKLLVRDRKTGAVRVKGARR